MFIEFVICIIVKQLSYMIIVHEHLWTVYDGIYVTKLLMPNFFDFEIFFLAFACFFKSFSKKNDNKFSLTYKKKRNFRCNLNDEQGILSVIVVITANKWYNTVFIATTKWMYKLLHQNWIMSTANAKSLLKILSLSVTKKIKSRTGRSDFYNAVSQFKSEFRLW